MPWMSGEALSGRESRAGVAQQLHPRLDDVGDAVAEHGGVARAVVARVGLGEAGELVDVLRPGELAAVDDDAGDDRSVSAEELGGRVHDDVGAVLERADEVRRRDRVVDDERDAVRRARRRRRVSMSRMLIFGLPMVSAKNSFVFGRTRGGPLVGVILVLDEGDLDAELGERVLEQVVGAAVDRRRRHDVVAGAGDVEHGVGDGRRAGGDGEGRGAALERGDALLEHVRGGVQECACRCCRTRRARTDSCACSVSLKTYDVVL